MSENRTALARTLIAIGVTPGTGLAKAAGIDISTLGAAVRGETTLTPAQRERLARILGVDATRLIDGRVLVAGPDEQSEKDVVRALRADGVDVISVTTILGVLDLENADPRTRTRGLAPAVTAYASVHLIPGWSSNPDAVLAKAVATAAGIPVRAEVHVEVDGESPTDVVETPLGNIRVLTSHEVSHPGVILDVVLPDGTVWPLAMTEFTDDDADERPHLATRVWSNTRRASASVHVYHEGVEPDTGKTGT